MCSGSCSTGNQYGSPADAGAALSAATASSTACPCAGSPAPPCPAPAAGTAAGEVAGAVAGAAGATAPNAAGDCWCATQRSNSAGCTVKVRNFMFACDTPQNSAQNPFHALDSIVESGVNQT